LTYRAARVVESRNLVGEWIVSKRWATPRLVRSCDGWRVTLGYIVGSGHMDTVSVTTFPSDVRGVARPKNPPGWKPYRRTRPDAGAMISDRGWVLGETWVDSAAWVRPRLLRHLTQGLLYMSDWKPGRPCPWPTRPTRTLPADTHEVAAP
jgi:hypothetical protein